MNASDLLLTLLDLETELHQLETRRNAARLDELLHPDFEEFGRSGRRYSRSDVLEELAGEAEFPAVVSSDFELHELGEGVALLTYATAHRGEGGELHRRTLRSSLWILGEEGWRMRFHQGTPAASATGARRPSSASDRSSD